MKLSLIYAYYDNPEMLRRHLMEWEMYPAAVKSCLSIFIVDDCSSKVPDFHFPTEIDGHLYRITEKYAWNWGACRNIGAHHAPSGWLLLTDMDHMVACDDMVHIMNELDNLDEERVYFLTRQNTDRKPIKPHGNSYLMTRDMYWRIGGHDEGFAGTYYGATGMYRKQLAKLIHPIQTLSIPLTFFTLDNISDAWTTEFELDFKVDFHKLKERKLHEMKILSFPYIKLK